MDVRIFLRKPTAGLYSAERIFTTVANSLPPGIKATKKVCPRVSQGVGNRLANVRWATREKGPVNHVGGDVHYLTLALPKRGSVLTVLDLVALRRLTGTKRAVFKKLWLDLPVKRAAVVTVISEAVKKELEAAVPAARGKTRVVPVPLLPGFIPDPKPWPEEGWTALMQGRAWNKNHERQFEALAGLGVKVRLVGALSDAGRIVLERNLVPYEVVEGISDIEMVAEYRRCDFVLFASLYEGFGMPIIEANAVGRPVVTSETGATHDVANGAACLVNPESVVSIREGVERVLEEAAYREELIRRGYENAKAYDPARIGRMYAEAYSASLTH